MRVCVCMYACSMCVCVCPTCRQGRTVIFSSCSLIRSQKPITAVLMARRRFEDTITLEERLVPRRIDGVSEAVD